VSHGNDHVVSASGELNVECASLELGRCHERGGTSDEFVA
jgi:hypothetical protein